MPTKKTVVKVPLPDVPPPSPMGLAPQAPPPPKWKVSFRIRSAIEVTVIDSWNEDREAAIAEAAARVSDLIKEPFGMKYLGAVRV